MIAMRLEKKEQMLEVFRQQSNGTVMISLKTHAGSCPLPPPYQNP